MDSDARLQITGTGAAAVRARAREGKQKDEFCGAFCAAVAIEAVSGLRVSQDAVAESAATVLSGGADPGLPPGESPRTDYLIQLALASDPATAGTSASGLVRAVGVVAGPVVAAVPLTGRWTATTVGLLLDLVGDPDTVVVLNAATRHLWPTHTDLLTWHRYLDGVPVEPGPCEWDVGHFILLVGSYVGSGRRLAVCADTYPSLGSAGIHLQPGEGLAAAMNRDDDPASTGGAIVLTTPAAAERVRERARAAGLDVSVWDNGTPDAALQS